MPSCPTSKEWEGLQPAHGKHGDLGEDELVAFMLNSFRQNIMP